MSEPATNVVTHTTGETFHITLARSDTIVAIAITDTGGTTHTPHVTHAADDATHLETTGDEHVHTITAELLVKPEEAHQQATARNSHQAAL